MYSLRLFSSSRDRLPAHPVTIHSCDHSHRVNPTIRPPSHNVFAATTLVITGPSYPSTKSQCIHCDYSHHVKIQLSTHPITKFHCDYSWVCLGIQLSTHKVTKYSLQLPHHCDYYDHPPSHNASLVATFALSFSLPPTWPQYILLHI